MSVTSLSFGSPIGSSRSTAPASQPARAAPRVDSDSGDSPAPARRNPLVAAMLEALKSLLPAAPANPTTAPVSATAATDASTATSSGTTTAAATAAGTDASSSTPAAAATANPATDLRDAAYAFAHALYGALHDAGSGREQHHHGHHRHGGYGNLAERLESLAQQVAGTAAPAATTPAPTAPANPVVPNGSPAVSPATAGASPAIAAAGSDDVSIDITIKIHLGASAAAPTPAATESPLLAAFKHLFTALNPNAATSGTSATEKLSAFLHQMGQALARSAAPSASAPSGSLLSVTA